jgi:hypothetical protein
MLVGTRSAKEAAKDWRRKCKDEGDRSLKMGYRI